MMDVATIQVDGYPPAKSEALSLLGAGHRHRDRVLRLLKAVQLALASGEAVELGHVPVVLNVELHCPRDGLRSDATNYLGGIADVLQRKVRRGSLEHLGDLAQVQLFDDDAQLEEIHYRWQDAETTSYLIRVSRCET